jgi:hypothetical protein
VLRVKRVLGLAPLPKICLNGWDSFQRLSAYQSDVLQNSYLISFVNSFDSSKFLIYVCISQSNPLRFYLNSFLPALAVTFK